MFTYIDLFAGCGGLSDGFEQSGFYKGLAHVEWEKIAANTLENRLQKKWKIVDSKERVFCFDIRRTTELINGWSDPNYGRSLGLKNTVDENHKVDVVIGGPPCQAYSIAGRIRDENQMENDYRNFLFESYIEVMRWSQPDVFLFENVVGILSASPGGVSITKRIMEALDSIGYITLDNLRDAIFKFNEFGIPQKRNRVIIVGLKKKAFKGKNCKQLLVDFYYNFTKNNEVLIQISASQVLEDLPKFIPNNIEETDNPYKSIFNKDKRIIMNHVPRFHNQRDIETFRILTSDFAAGNINYRTAQSIKNLYKDRTGKESSVHKYHVIKPNEPSNTIPAHLYKDGLRHIHWDPLQCRSITVREAARLQTFDDDFEFLGTMGDQFKMIGNAVPPKFARLISTELINLLSQRVS